MVLQLAPKSDTCGNNFLLRWYYSSLTEISAKAHELQQFCDDFLEEKSSLHKKTALLSAMQHIPNETASRGAGECGRRKGMVKWCFFYQGSDASHCQLQGRGRWHIQPSNVLDYIIYMYLYIY